MNAIQLSAAYELLKPQMESRTQKESAQALMKRINQRLIPLHLGRTLNQGLLNSLNDEITKVINEWAEAMRTEIVARLMVDGAQAQAIKLLQAPVPKFSLPEKFIVG